MASELFFDQFRGKYPNEIGFKKLDLQGEDGNVWERLM